MRKLSFVPDTNHFTYAIRKFILDMPSSSGGYHEYIGGCSVHRGDIMIHVGDTMSTWGDVQYIGGNHEYIGGIS